jgi:hypothetical protein
VLLSFSCEVFIRSFDSIIDRRSCSRSSFSTRLLIIVSRLSYWDRPS